MVDGFKELEPIETICRLAMLNFPNNTDLKIIAAGRHNGTVNISAPALLAFIERAKAALTKGKRT